MNIKKLLRENLNEISVNTLKQELQNIVDSYNGKINGKILTLIDQNNELYFE